MRWDFRNGSTGTYVLYLYLESEQERCSGCNFYITVKVLRLLSGKEETHRASFPAVREALGARYVLARQLPRNRPSRIRGEIFVAHWTTIHALAQAVV